MGTTKTNTGQVETKEVVVQWTSKRPYTHILLFSRKGASPPPAPSTVQKTNRKGTNNMNKILSIDFNVSQSLLMMNTIWYIPMSSVCCNLDFFVLYFGFVMFSNFLTTSDKEINFQASSKIQLFVQWTSSFISVIQTLPANPIIHIDWGVYGVSSIRANGLLHKY